MDNSKLDRISVVNITLVCEGALLLIVAVWSLCTGTSLLRSFEFARLPRIIALGVAAGLGTASVGFALMALVSKFKSPKWLVDMQAIIYNEIAPLFGQLTVFDIILISLASGLCEEAFYRGMLQNLLDIPKASIIFGIMHCPSIRMFPYAFMTFLAGLLLGWLYQITGSLWTPIIAHALNNLIVMFYFRRLIQKQKADQES